MYGRRLQMYVMASIPMVSNYSGRRSYNGDANGK